jgi:hypothetical protein
MVRQRAAEEHTMIRCDGCGCPIDPMLDVVLRVKYGNEHPWFCSAPCIEDYMEAKSEAQKAAALVTPINWRKYA